MPNNSSLQKEKSVKEPQFYYIYLPPGLWYGLYEKYTLWWSTRLYIKFSYIESNNYKISLVSREIALYS